VFTVSKAVKNELKKFVKYDNIEYIYNVLNFDLFDIKSNNITKSKHFNDKYILSIGVIESRKNYKTLINSAFLVKKIFPKIKFIIIGSKTSYISKLYDLIKLLNLENNIIFLHSVTDEELLQYYLKSSLFLFPSEYEGFGIPVLEAIRSKCKILLSDLNVFKELTENKVSYFNRYSSEDLAYHILNSLNSNSYFDENYFLDQEILENFHVEKVSNKIIKVYNSCVA
jgi:glycosyltransferase involved in cell wall biosynthesis